MLVNEGVKLGFADLVDPKSLTVDVRALVGAFAQDTNAIGVVKVEVREASRDPSLQLQGSISLVVFNAVLIYLALPPLVFLDMKDSYATLSLSTQPKKTVSSTRVLTNDKDPRWNENLYILVYAGKIGYN
jgi:Ca2+-dependent lipid-binding protein